MSSSRTIHLHIGNAIPPGDQKETAEIITLWRQFGDFFTECPFEAQSGINGAARPYHITFDGSGVLQLMEDALEHSQSFNGHRRAHIDNPDNAIDGELAITISSRDQPLEELESYQVATVFLQQLVMTANIIHPGAFQVLDARFTGEGAHRFEAQQYDARVLQGAHQTAHANGWPALGTPGLGTVWHWLEQTGVAKADTAIKDINRVLFTLLKVAEQRHEYSARTVLLVMYQLEVLLDCRESRSLEQLRNRTQLVLGSIPEAADCFTELHDVRNSLFLASQPVNRPPLICHNTAEALREQIGQHNTAVESGTALVLALLQDLVAHGSLGYSFSESVARQ